MQKKSIFYNNKFKNFSKLFNFVKFFDFNTLKRVSLHDYSLPFFFKKSSAFFYLRKVMKMKSCLLKNNYNYNYFSKFLSKANILNKSNKYK
jgi:hypothetical protein